MDVDSTDSNNEDNCTTNTQRLIAENGGRCMSTQAMQSLYDLRQNNLLCDAIIRLQDGGVFHIHRAILSACSTYFRFSLKSIKSNFLFWVHPEKGSYLGVSKERFVYPFSYLPTFSVFGYRYAKSRISDPKFWNPKFVEYSRLFKSNL